MTQNKVELIGYYGGDKRSCISAWQSTTEELGIELPESIPDRVDAIFEAIAKTKKKSPWELLDFLASEGHHTPMEKGILDFQITGDIASHIHALKHRISQINSESARYKEFVADRFYIPEDWAELPLQEDFLEDNGEIGYESGQYWSDVLKHESERHFKLYHQAVKDISKPLGRKRAKESARYFLGYNTQLNFDWQMNFRSFVNIQKLRNSSHAQREIKAIANTMLYLVENIPDKPFQYTLKAFGLKSTVEDNLFL